jgi:RNA-directed DNA polymerase
VDVGDTQTQLSQWAAQDRTHRFSDLYHLLDHEDWLRTAQAHVKQNAGSRTAGCDGMGIGKERGNIPESSVLTGGDRR